MSNFDSRIRTSRITRTNVTPTGNTAPSFAKGALGYITEQVNEIPGAKFGSGMGIKPSFYENFEAVVWPAARWYQATSSGGGTATIVDGRGVLTGAGAANSGYRIRSTAPFRDNCGLKFKFKFPTTGQQFFTVALKTSGNIWDSTGDVDNAYAAEFQPGSNIMRIDKYTNGSRASMNTAYYPGSFTDDWWFRMEVQENSGGTDVRMKIWDASTNESAGWDFNQTDGGQLSPGNFAFWYVTGSDGSPRSVNIDDITFYSI